MNKKVILIVGIAIAVVLATVWCAVFFGESEEITSSKRTLEEITLGMYGGGRLKFEVNEYKTVEFYFESTSQNGDERVGVCHFVTNYYKKASYSPSGKIFDRYEEEEYACVFTDYSLTLLASADYYNYSVETINGKEYVVFSKPFFGLKKWYVDKVYS